jgi:enoyl-[acyl-carrier protein] reductase II
LAKRLVRSGAAAIVIEGSEAGGHIGPVSLTVLAQEILPHLKDVPVFVAGGLGRGEAILSYLEMEASGAQFPWNYNLIDGGPVRLGPRLI